MYYFINLLTINFNTSHIGIKANANAKQIINWLNFKMHKSNIKPTGVNIKKSTIKNVIATE